MSKKAFILSESTDGCFYYRAEVFKKYSKNFEVSTNVNFVTNEVTSIADSMNRIMDSDIVILLRPVREDLYFYVIFWRLIGKIVFFSTDDSFSTIDPKNPAIVLKDMASVSHRICSVCDGAIVTTECLKTEIGEYNKNIVIVPNYLDFKDVSSYYQKPTDKKAKKIRIGLTGSVQTAENSEKFIEVLKKLNTNHFGKIEFVFFGDSDKEMHQRMKKIFRRSAIFAPSVTFQKYHQALSSLDIDIALIPRKDNVFNRCKSNCKYLEMSALKIATIAQGFKDGQSPYQGDIVNGVNGEIAISDKDWLKKTEELVNHPSRLAEIKENAYRFVRENYDVRKKIKIWDDSITYLIEQSNHKVVYDDDQLSAAFLSALLWGGEPNYGKVMKAILLLRSGRFEELGKKTGKVVGRILSKFKNRLS